MAQLIDTYKQVLINYKMAHNTIIQSSESEEKILRMILVSFNLRIQGTLTDLRDVRAYVDSKVNMNDGSIKVLDKLSSMSQTLGLLAHMNASLLKDTAKQTVDDTD